MLAFKSEYAAGLFCIRTIEEIFHVHPCVSQQVGAKALIYLDAHKVFKD